MKCPTCYAEFKTHSVAGDRPEGQGTGTLGDVGICDRCGGWWCAFAGDVMRYMPTDDELRAVADFYLRKIRGAQAN